MKRGGAVNLPKTISKVEALCRIRGEECDKKFYKRVAR